MSTSANKLIPYRRSNTKKIEIIARVQSRDRVEAALACVNADASRKSDRVGAVAVQALTTIAYFKCSKIKKILHELEEIASTTKPQRRVSPRPCLQPCFLFFSVVCMAAGAPNHGSARGCLPAAVATCFACKEIEDRAKWKRRPPVAHRARHKRSTERGASGRPR